MEYADLILRILRGADIEASLLMVIANIDANDRSVPTLEELNTALAELASRGHLQQRSETEYKLFTTPQAAAKYSLISSERYQEICGIYRSRMREYLRNYTG